MKASRIIALLAPSLLALGHAESAAADTTDQATLAQAASAIDLTGTWFAKVKTKADITAPLVGAAPSDVDLALKLFVKNVDGQLTADVAICNLATAGAALTLNFDRVEPFIVLTESVPAFTPAIGAKVPLPDVTFHIGQDAAGASVDIDGDKNPGGTVGAVALGLVPLDAYIGLDLSIQMDATLADATTVTGTATFSGTGKVFGSNFPLLTSGAVGVKQTLVPTPFTAKHYAGDVPCAELLKKP